MKWNIFDHGWCYVIAGLILTIAAIVLPAINDLSGLKDKEFTIAKSRDQLLLRKDSYEEFLGQLTSEDPIIQSRLLGMQYNISPQGVPVVIDTAASNTPLQWIEMKFSQYQSYDTIDSTQSLLTLLTSGTRRLWVAGFGITMIFLGIVLTPNESSHLA